MSPFLTITTLKLSFSEIVFFSYLQIVKPLRCGENMERPDPVCIVDTDSKA